MKNIYIHPVTAANPQAIRQLEQSTGGLAIALPNASPRLVTPETQQKIARAINTAERTQRLINAIIGIHRAALDAGRPQRPDPGPDAA